MRLSTFRHACKYLYFKDMPKRSLKWHIRTRTRELLLVSALSPQCYQNKLCDMEHKECITTQILYWLMWVWNALYSQEKNCTLHSSKMLCCLWENIVIWSHIRDNSGKQWYTSKIIFNLESNVFLHGFIKKNSCQTKLIAFLIEL